MDEIKVSEQSKQLVNKSLMERGVDENVQQMINKPQMDPTGVNATDSEYLEAIIKMINDGKLNLYAPDTLIKTAIYEALDYQSKGLADINAVNLLGDLRQMKKLYDSGDKESFQIQNLIQHIRNTKQRIEDKCGDVYII
ncbi:hypothetical protein C0416_05020 [bacterium]|nr:hypothetical protein [bacterium]